MSAWIRNPNAAMISFMCLGCRLGMRKGFLEVARRYPQIGMCITGGGEPEESMATAFFSTSASRWKRIMALTAGVAGEMLRNPRYLIPPTLPVRMVLEFLYPGFPR